ncbi:uncharacterized protein LOC114364912 [Ostrinia furnacalis]|uniref:uncharacterized protein LOC114364912 n=1 Tax=Ostrinia furnacalis TaxID=93504 RepID=UPI00103DA223|nr:uncharacterized protein LOC114364912 [Ostrinia furnacalis]
MQVKQSPAGASGLQLLAELIPETTVLEDALTSLYPCTRCGLEFYHFFTAEAILSMNYANGWSLPLKPRHRRCAHIFLQVCGLTCAVAGTALVLISRGYVKGQPHGITGLITLALAGLSVIFGPFNFLSRQNRFSPFFKIVHMGVGMPTFFMSSISLCLGFLTSEFKSWAASVVVYVLTAFVVFYTAFILANVFIKCMSRI